MKSLIFACLITYAMSQATGVCLYDRFAPSFNHNGRILSKIIKPTCPLNKAMCCDTLKLTNLKKEFKSHQADLVKFFGGISEVNEYIFQLFGDNKFGMRMANWKNNSTCKGKNVSPLRRLQGVQLPCPQSGALTLALKKFNEAHPNFKSDASKCLEEVVKVRAGATCTLCNRAPTTQVDQANNKIFVDHKTVEMLMRTKCGDYLDGLTHMNIITNKMKALLPTKRRRLQGMVIDYIGFNINSCSLNWVKKNRRLQGMKKDSVQSYKECADLGLWLMNGLVMNHGPWALNPDLMKVVGDVTEILGTPKAKESYKKLSGSVMRNLQGIKPSPKPWTFAFNANFDGALLTDLAPSNVNDLTD